MSGEDDGIGLDMNTFGGIVEILFHTICWILGVFISIKFMKNYYENVYIVSKTNKKFLQAQLDYNKQNKILQQNIQDLMLNNNTTTNNNKNINNNDNSQFSDPIHSLQLAAVDTNPLHLNYQTSNTTKIGFNKTDNKTDKNKSINTGLTGNNHPNHTKENTKNITNIKNTIQNPNAMHVSTLAKAHENEMDPTLGDTNISELKEQHIQNRENKQILPNTNTQDSYNVNINYTNSKTKKNNKTGDGTHQHYEIDGDNRDDNNSRSVAATAMVARFEETQTATQGQTQTQRQRQTGFDPNAPKVKLYRYTYSNIQIRALKESCFGISTSLLGLTLIFFHGWFNIDRVSSSWSSDEFGALERMGSLIIGLSSFITRWLLIETLLLVLSNTMYDCNKCTIVLLRSLFCFNLIIGLIMAFLILIGPKFINNSDLIRILIILVSLLLLIIQTSIYGIVLGVYIKKSYQIATKLSNIGNIGSINIVNSDNIDNISNICNINQPNDKVSSATSSSVSGSQSSAGGNKNRNKNENENDRAEKRRIKRKARIAKQSLLDKLVLHVNMTMLLISTHFMLFAFQMLSSANNWPTSVVTNAQVFWGLSNIVVLSFIAPYSEKIYLACCGVYHKCWKKRFKNF